MRVGEKCSTFSTAISDLNEGVCSSSRTKTDNCTCSSSRNQTDNCMCSSTGSGAVAGSVTAVIIVLIVAVIAVAIIALIVRYRCSRISLQTTQK